MFIDKGENAEFYVMMFLRSHDIICEKNNNFKLRYDYDLLCKLYDKEFTIEVKNDIKSSQTDNLAIEVHNTRKGSPSGLTATKADLWFYVMISEVWITRTTDLRAYTHKNKPKRIIDRAGDCNAKILLYDKSSILNSVFYNITELKHKEVRKKLWMMIN